MANLTITIDNEILRRARLRALEQILRLSSQAVSGRGNRRWTRDDLHERR
jgi:hypothetical protein